jgi:hypothetical protein
LTLHSLSSRRLGPWCINPLCRCAPSLFFHFRGPVCTDDALSLIMSVVFIECNFKGRRRILRARGSIYTERSSSFLTVSSYSSPFIPPCLDSLMNLNARRRLSWRNRVISEVPLQSLVSSDLSAFMLYCTHVSLIALKSSSFCKTNTTS